VVQGGCLELFHSKAKYDFCGAGKPFDECRVVVLPVPYDATTSYGGGARDGPHAIISASRQLELYDEELGCEPAAKGFYTLDELEPSTDGPKQTIERVEEAVEAILEAKRFPVMLGGEHSLTLGAVEAARKKHPEMGVLQFDAHADLRDEFEGSKYNHACVMRRVSEKGIACAQVGVRSVIQEEIDYAAKKGNRIFYAIEKAKWKAEKIAASLPREVYVTFDLDALDSSLMPATGTPQPGGLSWSEATFLLREVMARKKIIGLDVMELAPIPGMRAPDFVAAKLAYKMIGYALCTQKNNNFK
jgi:agmatinase